MHKAQEAYSIQHPALPHASFASRHVQDKQTTSINATYVLFDFMFVKDGCDLANFVRHFVGGDQPDGHPEKTGRPVPEGRYVHMQILYVEIDTPSSTLLCVTNIHPATSDLCFSM